MSILHFCRALQTAREENLTKFISAGFASPKNFNDSSFKSFSDFVLTKLIVSVMDNRRTNKTNLLSIGKNKLVNCCPPPDTSALPDYLQDEEFMTSMCYDSMLDQLQQSLCSHLGLQPFCCIDYVISCADDVSYSLSILMH